MSNTKIQFILYLLYIQCNTTINGSKMFSTLNTGAPDIYLTVDALVEILVYLDQNTKQLVFKLFGMKFESLPSLYEIQVDFITRVVTFYVKPNANDKPSSVTVAKIEEEFDGTIFTVKVIDYSTGEVY